MPKRRSQHAREPAQPIWTTCRKCCDQMFGGPRCYDHNPTPEMREANPSIYPAAARSRSTKAHPDVYPDTSDPFGGAGSPVDDDDG